MLPERNAPESQERSTSRLPEKKQEEQHPNTAFTHIPNAHASGVGAMGRNDEKLPSPPDREEDRPDPAY